MKRLLVLLPFCLSFAAYAEEPPQALSLKDAQSLALKKHPEIISSDYRVQAAGQAVKEARSAYYPQANANAVRAFADDGTRLAAVGGINNPTSVRPRFLRRGRKPDDYRFRPHQSSGRCRQKLWRKRMLHARSRRVSR